MDILQIIGLGLSGTIAALVLKEYKPVFALCISTITALVIFLSLLHYLSYIFDTISVIAARLSVDGIYIALIIRMIGIAYASHFGSALCRDAGQNAIAQKIELAGKIIIIISSMPILTSVLNVLIGILPT